MKDTSCCWRQRWRHTATSATRDGRPSVSSSPAAVRQPWQLGALTVAAVKRHATDTTPPCQRQWITPREDPPSGMRTRPVKATVSSNERTDQTQPERTKASWYDMESEKANSSKWWHRNVNQILPPFPQPLCQSYQLETHKDNDATHELPPED